MSKLERDQGPEDRGQAGMKPLESPESAAWSKTKSEAASVLGFGRDAHVAYQRVADNFFDEVEAERPVRVHTESDEELNGRVDLVIDENQLVDFKTNDMRQWSVGEATRFARAHGKQLRDYVDSPDTPDDSVGYIVSTVPPEDAAARATYQDVTAEYRVKVVFSESEQPEDVMTELKSYLSTARKDSVEGPKD